jgi:hypothetical protein
LTVKEEKQAEGEEAHNGARQRGKGTSDVHGRREKKGRRDKNKSSWEERKKGEGIRITREEIPASEPTNLYANLTDKIKKGNMA